MKASNLIVGILGVLITFAGINASAGAIIAQCSITKFNQPNGVIVFIEAWDHPSDPTDLLPVHATYLYTEAENHYSFWAPFSNNLSRVNISIGHSSGGGVASDYHFQGDLNKSNLVVTDMKAGIEINCIKK